MDKLEDAEVESRLSELEGWQRSGDAICKEFERNDFVGSVDFAKQIVGPAEEMGHHPDLEISWDTVKVMLTTHSEGGVTESDFELAGKIDELV